MREVQMKGVPYRQLTGPAAAALFAAAFDLISPANAQTFRSSSARPTAMPTSLRARRQTNLRVISSAGRTK
jgi:hypothetical protein